jgi:hypothetical protein
MRPYGAANQQLPQLMAEGDRTKPTARSRSAQSLPLWTIGRGTAQYPSSEVTQRASLVSI